jgi:hypothetical protein
LIHLRFSPDAPTVAMDDALHNRQPHAGALILFNAVQPLKHTEQLVSVPHIKAHAVILDEIDLLAILFLAADFDSSGLALAGVLARSRAS